MFENTIARLVAAGFGARADFEGASEREIADIEARFGCAVPEPAAHSWLRLENAAVSSFRGSDVEIRWRPPFNAYVEALDTPVTLPAA